MIMTVGSVREILKNIEALSEIADQLGEDDNLFEKGLDSFGSVQVMLALEQRCEIEFPDHLLNRRSFESIRSIRETVASLTTDASA